MRRCIPFLLLAWCVPLAALEVPFLAGRVNDGAGLLSPGASSRIEATLEALERETGAQVAVLTVPSLEGEVLEDFSIRVVETWKLGRAEQDTGVLLLIARDDRKMRIEVGYGLEGALTDLGSKRIISNLMVPRFRNGDFDGGIEAAVEAIVGTVRGEEGLIPPEPPSAASSDPAETIGFLALFFFFLGRMGLGAAASKSGSSWAVYVLLMPFFFIFPAVVVSAKVGLIALLVWVVSFPILRAVLPKTSFGPRVSGWSSGWSGGRGGFSGGGFSGGGFSGGGGSFGGGGASGSW